MRSFLSPIFVAALFIFMSVAPGRSQTVSGSIGNGSVAKGAVTRGTVVIDIPSGLHVNSNRPSSQYAIPTTVRVTSPGARVGRITFPRGRDRKFQFSEQPINVYEGRVAFPFTLTLPAAFKGESVRVRAVVRFQACTEEVCYPPKTKEITLTAKVR